MTPLLADVFDTFNGLPVHVLVVHAVVVLAPLSALGALLIAAVPRWRPRFAGLVVIGAGVSTVAAFVAVQSGEVLASRVGEPEDHARLGAALRWWLLAFFVVALVFWIVVRGDRPAVTPVVATVLAVVLVVAGGLATFFTFRTGETGSQAVWEPVVQNTQPGSISDDDGSDD